MKLVPSTDPILLKPTERFDFENPPMDPIELFEQMKEVMVASKGIGLSACQVGLPYSMFIMGHYSMPDEILPVFNPRIVNYEGEPELVEEGCLSFPGLFIKVKRYPEIRIRFANEKGIVDTVKMDGLAAQIAQHEYDHSEGILFTKRASRLHLQQAKKQKEKLDRLRKRNMQSAKYS